MPPLMLSRRFAPLFWCQFFAAFNDNFLKTALVFLILFQMAGDNSDALITLASAVFIAPFFFLSGLAGELADRFDKARMAQVVKFAEMFIAGLSVYGYEHHSIAIMFVALAGFGVMSALFGPVKYGILPDHLRREELPAGNALVEGATFIAILTGTITAGLAARDGGDIVLFGALVMAFALACWLSALLIPPTGQGAPQLKVRANIAASTARHVPPSAQRPPAVVGRAGDELVLGGRHRRAVAAAAADQEPDRRQRRRRHRLSRAVLDRGRHRLGPCRVHRARAHRAEDHACRRRAAGSVCARSRLCRLRQARRRKRCRSHGWC